ncbi:peptide-methionine (S)-S-oxide reductase MsrA [Thiorhodococcus mannitoliphagus]|uniref:Peptide methionine sulfoxide reductase MsrA n=1 Tax=Thiorhodococcus mannitoliphagus TaxID=329406 RepID=A0A6P1E1U0_9GAMM|nr:peptide-methionine (S)-S-oxide reductase MsrA [Thiorhodococcus mannitoliphagus]NEX23301.1 peptide-methionine (S)-S-oxide reductase MsrA [Thiorhodococcus mannitoliphagus]
MRRRLLGLGLKTLAAATFLTTTWSAHAEGLPDPKVDETPTPGTQTAVLGGGCFWGVEAVFEHVRGVSDVVSGYAGGDANTATYRRVSSGRTSHAESVRITYDPSQVTYGQLLKVFFEVAHDPTQRDRQGPDVGTQYRSAIFYANEEQARIAQAYIDQLNAAGVYAKPIVTQVTPLEGFYDAEAYHQDYLPRHPTQPYIVIHDQPKLTELERRLPELYRAK